MALLSTNQFTYQYKYIKLASLPLQLVSVHEISQYQQCLTVSNNKNLSRKCLNNLNIHCLNK